MKKLLSLVLSLLLLLGVLAGCGASGDATAADQSAPAASEAPTAPAEDMASGGCDAEYAPEYAPADTPMEPSGGLDTAVESAGGAAKLTEKIIYSADLDLESTDFDTAAAALDALAGQYGGFVESSQITGNTDYAADGSVRVVDRRASYTLRVPSDRFQACLRQAGSMGNVISSSTAADNITSQFTDQEARRDTLLIQEERLLAMLEKSEDLESLLGLEARLADVRYEIESIERTLRNWQNQVDYSTIRVNLREVAVYTPTAPVQRTFSQQLSDALRSGWQGFVRAVKAVTLWVLSWLPALVILAAVAVAVLLILRRRARKHAPPAQEKSEEKKDS